MEAKRISTGEMVEVSELTFTNMKTNIIHRSDIKNGGFIAESDLEFLPEESKEETIEGWVCRNGYDGDIKDSILHLFLKGEPFPDYDRPERVSGIRMWRGANGLHLPSEMFPEVTWESEPKEVRITITPIEE